MKLSVKRMSRIYMEDGQQSRFSVDADTSIMIGRTVTTVVLFDRMHNRPHIGTATCHPKDRYSHEDGERIALDRAFDDFLSCNPRLLISYALAYDITLDETRRRFWKRLRADIYYTQSHNKEEITDGKPE